MRRADEQSVERVGDSQPRSITSTSSSGPSASPSTERLTIREPGAAARIRSRSRDR